MGCRVEQLSSSNWAAEASWAAKKTVRLHGMSRIVEVVKPSYWAPGAEALWAG